MANAAKRALIYCRQSSGKEEDSESIAFQEESCRNYAVAHGMRVNGVFQDANTPGRLYPTGAEELMKMDFSLQEWLRLHTTEKRFRPGLGEAIAEFENADVLLVFDLSRLYRPVQNSYLQSYINSRLLHSGIELVSLKEGRIDFSNFTDSLVSSIKSQVNDNQIALTREKSKQAMARLQDSGYYPTIPKMYGVRYLGGKERIVEVIPEKAEVIRFVYNAILTYTPYATLLRELNERFAGLQEGKSFYDTSWRHIIANPFYCGYMYDSHGALIKARQMDGKEIVSFEQWKRVNEIVNSPRASRYERKNMLHPFSGLMRCGCCGSKMSVILDFGKISYACLSGVNVRHNSQCGKSRANITLVRHSEEYTGLKESLQPLLLLALFKELERIANPGEIEEQIRKRDSQLKILNSKAAELADAYAKDEITTLGGYQKAFEAVEKRSVILKNELVKLKESQAVADVMRMKSRDYLQKASRILNGELAPYEYKALLHQAITGIVCHRECLEIATIYGDFTLRRVMRGPYRNFPRYTFRRIHLRSDGTIASLNDCRFEITYLYGGNFPGKTTTFPNVKFIEW